jgi:hypothetical protein
LGLPQGYDVILQIYGLKKLDFGVLGMYKGEYMLAFKQIGANFECHLE